MMEGTMHLGAVHHADQTHLRVFGDDIAYSSMSVMHITGMTFHNEKSQIQHGSFSLLILHIMKQ
jgi:hypothetical protein